MKENIDERIFVLFGRHSEVMCDVLTTDADKLFLSVGYVLLYYCSHQDIRRGRQRESLCQFYGGNKSIRFLPCPVQVDSTCQGGKPEKFALKLTR